jgi:hypothetical protein
MIAPRTSMSTFLVIVLIAFLLSCAASSARDDGPSKPGGEPCGGQTCAPPAKCIDVSGMRAGDSRKECWITCSADSDCPKGKACAMIEDGPGQVCVETLPKHG